jgi:hypothetical protein
MLKKKRGILWHALSVNLTNLKYIAIAMARLQNFCINERIFEGRRNALEIDPCVESGVDNRLTSSKAARQNLLN